jgi:hypothetical protein
MKKKRHKLHLVYVVDERVTLCGLSSSKTIAGNSYITTRESRIYQGILQKGRCKNCIRVWKKNWDRAVK